MQFVTAISARTALTGFTHTVAARAGVTGMMKTLAAEWGEYGKAAKAHSYCDGLANTRAMAAAGSELAKHMLSLQIGEHNDWYLPSRDELELCYRNLKPTGDPNDCAYRDGDKFTDVTIGEMAATVRRIAAGLMVGPST